MLTLVTTPNPRTPAAGLPQSNDCPSIQSKPGRQLATLLAEAPASTRRNDGLTMFRSNRVNDLAPACYTGSRGVRVPAY